MHFPTTLTLLSTLSILTSAAPTTAANSTISKQFYLKTALKSGKGSGAHNKRFNNLYVTPYHTGAGLNDVVLAKAIPTEIPSFLNGTYLQFNFTNEPGVPYGMENALQTEYTSWQPSTINTGYGASPSYSAFFINSTGLQWTSDPSDPTGVSEFYGWRVCDWWHDVPQLFWMGPDAGADTPSSCSDVDLVVEDCA